MATVINSTWALLTPLLLYTFWRLFKAFFVKSALSNIAGPPKASLWSGNFQQLFDTKGWDFHRDIVQKYGSVVKIHGLFGASNRSLAREELLYVTDPRALHHILIKDENIYEVAPQILASAYLVFGKNLLSSIGHDHRRQRKMLNPVFSIKHMRGLTDVFYSVAYELRDVLTRKVQSGEEEINVLDWMSRAALEYIGQGGLGYSFEALDKSKTNAYADSIKMFVPTVLKLAVFREYLPELMKIGSPSFRRKLVEWIPSKTVQESKRIVDIMDVASNDIYSKKKEAFARGDEEVVKQIGQGNDIMSVLLRANMQADDKDKLPEDELIGQMTTLIFAGQDTTSHALSRTFYLLSSHQEVQDKLREEVTLARKQHRDLDYDTLMSLPYLDAVCRETLRVYPPVPFLNRMTRQDVVMPLAFPIKSVNGKTEITEILLKKNTNIIANFDGLNRSTAIWGEDAVEWKPERWLNPLPESVAEARLPGVYSSTMTFSGGRRACIGFKFAEMEMKLVLSVMLESFLFSPTKKEIYWNMSTIVTPVVKGAGHENSQLPLKVTLIQK